MSETVAALAGPLVRAVPELRARMNAPPPDLPLSDATADAGLPAYYAGTRADVIDMIPAAVDRALDIGCGAGNTLALLKRHGLVRWTMGMELHQGAARAAAARLDRVQTGNCETDAIDLAPESVDLILCMDVLEHLVDPWAMMRRLHPLLRPGGVLVANIPNVRHIKVVWDLAVRGRWRYADDGILDRTHLRFFTRDGARALVECSGLRVERIKPVPGLKPWKNKWIYNRLLFGALTDLYPVSYMMRARRP